MEKKKTKHSRRPWSKDELELLAQLYPNNKAADLVEKLNHSIGSIYRAASSLGLKKSEAFLQSDLSGRVQRGKQLPAMQATQFKKGHSSWNKGKKGWAAPGTERTRFTSGHTPHNTKADGVITMRYHSREKRYYMYIRIGLGKWQLYNRYVYMQHYGAIPPNHLVAFKDGNTLNCNIDNLMLVSRKENVLRNSIQRYPKEVQQVMKLTRKLQTLINKKKNGK